MISAYMSPATLQNLIRSLNREDVDFYVHIDKKVDANPFKCSFEDSQNVFFLPDDKRIRVYWGATHRLNINIIC